MTKTLGALVLGVLTSATSLAQAPVGADELPPNVPPVPDPPPDPARVVPPRPPQPPSVEPKAAARTARPAGMAIGLGAGYALPTSIQTPNTTSARLRLASGLALEPRLVLQNTSSKQETDVSETSTSQRELGIGSLVRIPMVSRGKFDLLLLGAAGVSIEGTDPDGPDNNTNATTFTVGWGVAIDWWMTEHWAVSFSATNPIFSFSKQTREEPAPVGETSTTTTVVGAVWDPTLSVMIHIFN
ncbi:MAG: hypothetical protein ACKV2T_16320 [Kofleriaceae bacterium]